MKDESELLSKATQAWEQRQWEPCIEAYERVLKHFPQSLEAHQGLARVQSLLGMPKTTVSTLKAALEFCQEESQLEAALNIIQRILELQPYDYETHQQRIDLLFRHAQTEKAIFYSRQLAQQYQAQDEGEKAIQLLVRSFQLKPDDMELISILAEAYLAHGLLREATGMFRQILPRLIDQGQFEKAVNVLRRLTVVNPKDVQTFMELGDVYLRQEKLQEAEQQFRAVLRLDLQHREALFQVAKICALRKQFRDSTLIYQRILSTDPEDTQAHYALGQVYKEQGMPQEAVKHLLMGGLASFEKEDKELARSCFESVLSIEPENPIASRQMKVLA